MAARRPQAWVVQITQPALKELENLPDKERVQVTNRIRALSNDPHPPGSKKLQGDGEAGYRERSGKYRILYNVSGTTVTVVGVRHRREAYRG